MDIFESVGKFNCAVKVLKGFSDPYGASIAKSNIMGFTGINDRPHYVFFGATSCSCQDNKVFDGAFHQLRKRKLLLIFFLQRFLIA